MTKNKLNVRIKNRYDTLTNWTNNNPILLAGEIGIETDTKSFKIGDGDTNWNNLDYYLNMSVVDKTDVNRFPNYSGLEKVIKPNLQFSKLSSEVLIIPSVIPINSAVQDDEVALFIGEGGFKLWIYYL